MVLSASLSTDLRLLLNMITWIMVYYPFWKFLTKVSPPVYTSQWFSPFLSQRWLFLTALFLSGASCTWVKMGYMRYWGILGFWCLLRGTTAVFWRCLGTSPRYQNTSQVLPALGLELGTLRFPAQATTDRAVPHFHNASIMGDAVAFLHILETYKVSFPQMWDTPIVRGLHQTLGHFCWLVHSRWLWRRSADLK